MTGLLTGAGLVLVGAALGAALVWRLYGPMVEAAREDARQASERLLQAWRDGYTIPAPPDAEAPTPEPEVLDGALLAFIEQFDDMGQMVYTAKARRIRHESPELSPGEIVQRLERDRVSMGVS